MVAECLGLMDIAWNVMLNEDVIGQLQSLEQPVDDATFRKLQHSLQPLNDKLKRFLVDTERLQRFFECICKVWLLHCR